MKMRYLVHLYGWLAILSSFSHSIDEVKPQHGGSLESVDVLSNGSINVAGSYEAVDLTQAATEALPDEELKDLLHWAISAHPLVLDTIFHYRIM